MTAIFDRRDRDAAFVIEHHTLPAKLFIGQRVRGYDRIYKIEELSQLALDLNARTGREIG
ncbi:hypothetical protein [Primorskyibacter sp. S87]|uniref:hypothetical protein n=1 Tax=Primorskyibacter sp. S87 TaxID=3415126 RepID=UPI003C7A949E